MRTCLKRVTMWLFCRGLLPYDLTHRIYDVLRMKKA
jgi:hypothetical protein